MGIDAYRRLDGAKFAGLATCLALGALTLGMTTPAHADQPPNIRVAQEMRGTALPAKTRARTTIVAKTTKPKKNVVRSARLRGNSSKTTFQIELSSGVPAEVFTLANPYRVVIDLPDVAFALPEDAGQKGHGLVSAFRFGLFAARKARIVLDTKVPALIENARMRTNAKGGVTLDMTLTRTDRKTFGAGTGAARSGPKVQRSDSAATRRAKKPLPKPSKKKAQNAKPIVVIDAGHGGIDPGATSHAKKVYEKSIVLAVAKRLKDKLAATGRYVVHLTRRTDVFISLARRVAKSKQHGADIFISIHADSISDTRYTNSVSGATVYTLSDRASDEASRLMAEKENSVDALAGLGTQKTEKAVEVRNILIDLLKRETANFSTDLSNAIVKKFKPAVALSRKPSRSADFKVLRQTRTPSVLIELGYMSNARDVRTMAAPKWQARTARAIAAAIDTYFAKHAKTAVGPR